jgi:hypothetical protein
MIQTNKTVSWIIHGSAFAIILVLIICLISSCSTKSDSDNIPEQSVETQKEETFDKDIYVIDIEKDSNGNVLHKTVFNAVTKHTYIYTFTYNANAWGMNVSTSVVIVNEDGSLTVPSVDNELPVNPVG